MDADSFISHVKTEDIYKHTGKDTSKRKKKQESYSLNETCIRWKNNKRLCRIKVKTYSYLTDDNNESKKQMVQKLYKKPNLKIKEKF